MTNATRTLDSTIKESNDKLTENGIHLKIERRGMKLSLRGSMPSVNGSKKQKRISLGYPATSEGVRHAFNRAVEIWQEIKDLSPTETIHDAVKKYICLETEVPAGDGRADGITNSDEVVEVKSNNATAQDVGQLFRYMVSLKKLKGKIIAPDFNEDAVKMIEILNTSEYSILAAKITIEEVVMKSGMPNEKLAIR